jgi:hypothetical protein
MYDIGLGPVSTAALQRTRIFEKFPVCGLSLFKDVNTLFLDDNGGKMTQAVSLNVYCTAK